MSKKILFFLMISFSHSSFSFVVFINPVKIKKFLEWHGRHKKNFIDDGQEWLPTYRGWVGDPWSLKEMWSDFAKEKNPDLLKEIRQKIKNTFDNLAEKNKKIFEGVKIAQMSEKEIKQFVYSAIWVRPVPWSKYSHFLYPEKVINYLENLTINGEVSIKYFVVENGYELIKIIGDVVASYFDLYYLDGNFLDENLTEEPDTFVFITQSKECGNIQIISLPAFSQDQLYKNDDLYKEIASTNFYKRKTFTFCERFKFVLYYLAKLQKSFLRGQKKIKIQEMTKEGIKHNIKIKEDLKEINCPDREYLYRECSNKKTKKTGKMKECCEMYGKLNKKVIF